MDKKRCYEQLWKNSKHNDPKLLIVHKNLKDTEPSNIKINCV